MRLQAGINPFDFSWKLAPGEAFVTPEVLLSYTQSGLNRLSQQYHDLIRTHLGHTKAVGKRRPIVINNWEATYFNFDEQKLLDLIGSCKDLGIDVLFSTTDGSDTETTTELLLATGLQTNGSCRMDSPPLSKPAKPSACGSVSGLSRR